MSAADAMLEPSGPAWCARWSTSTSLDDLAQPFQDSARHFIEALRNAGAAVHVSATYRPPERAYLMHWCCKIASGDVAPSRVPHMAGVDIDWTHDGDMEAAHTAAILMRHEYDIAFPAALVSRHTQRRAVDMTITWRGTIHVTDARGIVHACDDRRDLWPIGASYGVKKLSSDPPHWSDDGH